MLSLTCLSKNKYLEICSTRMDLLIKMELALLSFEFKIK